MPDQIETPDIEKAGWVDPRFVTAELQATCDRFRTQVGAMLKDLEKLDNAGHTGAAWRGITVAIVESLQLTPFLAVAPHLADQFQEATKRAVEARMMFEVCVR